MKNVKPLSGAEIKRLRDKLFYTQAQLADMLGIDRTVLSKLERDLGPKARGPLLILLLKIFADVRAGRPLPPTERIYGLPKTKATRTLLAARRRARMTERKAAK